MSILDAIFGKAKETFAKPIKDCRNCTYFRPQEGYYGYCSKHNTKLVMNQAPLCPDYMAYGEVTSRIDASHLISGVIDLARIPRVDLTKIPLGTSGYFLKGQGASDAIYALLTSGDIPSLDTAKITTGIFDVARIPDLGASKITSGVFDLARIPRVDLTKIPLGTSGYFLKGQGASDSIYALLTAGDIPSLDASKIASGVFDQARTCSPSLSIPSRSLGTQYQNGTRNIMVFVTVFLATGSGSAGLEAYIGSASAGTFIVGQQIHRDASYSQVIGISFIVPFNWYYQVNSVGSGVALNTWKELRL